MIHHRDTEKNLQFAICNLQLVICKVQPSAAKKITNHKLQIANLGCLGDSVVKQ
jgi:hypothetical protein